MRDRCAFEHFNAGGLGRFLILCDHASHQIPDDLSSLGVSDTDRLTHIGWDIGAERISRLLAKRFDSPAVICGVSRLVIDCNRRLTHAALVPPSSDGIDIPGNRNLSTSDIGRRIERFYLPYHSAVAVAVSRFEARGVDPIILSIHSFTPTMNGKQRPWSIGLSHTPDRRLSSAMIDALRRKGGFEVGDDQPYDADAEVDYTIFAYGHQAGRRHLQVEFRQDLVATDIGADHWGTVFADAVEEVVAASP